MRCSLEHYRPNLYEIVVAATCSDGILNQGETRIDCGGPCPVCACTSDAQCSDGLFCTGTETCDDFGMCSFGPAPCAGATWCSETTDDCRPYGDGDFDSDGDVDLYDFRAFQDCFGAPGLGACAAGKMTGSGVIGAADLAAFTAQLSTRGPN